MRIPFLRRLDRHMREIVRGASVAFVMKVITGVLTFGMNVFVARLFGADGAGIFFLALTVTTIAAVLGRIGLDHAILRFTAAASSTANWPEVKGLYQRAMSLALGTATVSAVVVYSSADWLSRTVFSKPELTTPLQIMALAVPPLIFAILHGELLKGLKEIFNSHLVNGVAVPGLFLLFLLSIGRTRGTWGAAGSYLVAATIAALVGLVLWHINTPQTRGISGRFSTRTLLRSSMPLFWVATMTLIMGWSSTFVLGIWGDAADVGIFHVAYRTAFLTSAMLASVNSIAAPKFAALHRHGDKVALGTTARNSARMMCVLAAPILAVFLIAPAWIMSLFGAEFSQGGTLLVILALGQFVNVATGSVGFVLIMTGNERLARNNATAAAALNIALNVTLVPLAGALGAAIATAVSVASLNLGAAYLAWSRVGIQTIPLSWTESG